MSNNDNKVHHSELPKLLDDGANNNYGEWRTKSYYKLREWRLLRFIEGDDSEAPIIPPLRHEITTQGLDPNGVLTTVIAPGNLTQRQQALKNAEPWMEGNDTALAQIVSAVPTQQMHLVNHTEYAKEAWDNLRSTYQPHNSLRASTIKGQIMAYRCQPDMNITKWLIDMQQLYNSLCDFDIERMTDREFALAILDLMPQDDDWRNLLSDLRTKVREADTQGLPIKSSTFTTAIRDEYWYRHRDDYQATSHIFSARFEAQKRSNAQKRPRPFADPSPSISNTSPPALKRIRQMNPD